MKENIRDSELQNFVERAVMDCFNVIDADKNKEPCKSSQYLLNCLASKGREVGFSRMVYLSNVNQYL